MKLVCVASAILTAFSSAVSESVTPVEKVITLIEDLKTEVEAEGKTEAGTYDAFACFCKDTTHTKASSITGGRDNIDLLSAEIADKTAAKEQKESELAERRASQESDAKDLASTEAQFKKEQAENEAAVADLNKAISSLNAAIKAMQAAKGASLLAVRSEVERSLALADIMNLITTPKHQAVTAFMQTAAGVDPEDPTYKYHSQGIVSTLENLLKDFAATKKTVDEDWAVAKGTFEKTIKEVQEKMGLNTQAMATLASDSETLGGDIAKARESLLTAEGLLKDDQLYLKDLTEQCEARAKDWDQRSQLRADELKALAGALEILKSKVSGADAQVNKRALVQKSAVPSFLQVGRAPQQTKSVATKVPAALAQESGRRLRGATVVAASVAQQARQDKIVSLLGQEGRRLNSAVLASLAMRLSDDPFTKVKTLIQQLIERLLQEATSEATKKGFCDTEMGKATQDRDFRLADTKKLDQEIQALEIKLSELEEELVLLSSALTKLRADLKEATELRSAEKKSNLEVVAQAKEGLVAVKEALDILKVFYQQAAKAAFVQASPVDEDTSGAGFSGAYNGKQQQSGGIIGMLEVIASDFDRTARQTEAAEKASHEEFVEFDRVSQTDIGGKETKKTLDEEDVKTTQNSITQKFADLVTAQNLLDLALNRLGELNPMCVDTGMSFEERVAKREEEVVALKKALCILDTDGVEADCK